MRTILRWYHKYEKTLIHFVTWMAATEKRLAASLFVFLFGMGLALAWQPFQAVADGASWAEPRTFVSKGNIVYTTVWKEAIPGILFLVASLFVPVYFLLSGANWAAGQRPVCKANAGKSKRRPHKSIRQEVKTSSGDTWKWIFYSIPAGFYAIFVLYPLWLVITGLEHGMKLDSPLYPTLAGLNERPMSLGLVATYCLFMLIISLEVFLRHRYKRGLFLISLSYLTRDLRDRR